MSDEKTVVVAGNAPVVLPVLRAILSDVGACLRPLEELCTEHGTDAKAFYAAVAEDSRTWQEFTRAISLRKVIAFDAILAKISELEQIADGEPPRGRNRQERSADNKAQWARIQAAKVALDSLKWVCSSSALFSPKMMNVSVNAHVTPEPDEENAGDLVAMLDDLLSPPV